MSVSFCIFIHFPETETVKGMKIKYRSYLEGRHVQLCRPAPCTDHKNADRESKNIPTKADQGGVTVSVKKLRLCKIYNK